MHIALISGSYPPIKCGIGDYTARLATTLANFGHQVDVLTSPPGSPTGQQNLNLYAQITQWGFRSIPEVLKKIQQLHPDIINIQYPTQEYHRSLMINILPGLFKARLGISSVATIHEFSSYTLLGRIRLTLTAKLSQAVIVTDPLNCKLLLQWSGASEGKYTLIPIGSNLLCMPPLKYDRTEQRVRLGVSADSVVLAYFGFIGPSKGVDTLLKAFGDVLASTPQVDLRLWLVTDREPTSESYRLDYEAFSHQVANFPYPNRLIWTGYLEPSDVSAYLLAADVAVLPFKDGVSLRRGSLLAALTHSLPVISTIGLATDTGQLNQESGLYLVPTEDTQALAKAIVMLANDASLRKTLAARANQFSQTFSWNSIATQTLDVYHKVPCLWSNQHNAPGN